MPDDWRFKLVDTGIRRSLSETNYSSSEVKIETRRIHAKEESARVRPHCPAMQGHWVLS